MDDIVENPETLKAEALGIVANIKTNFVNSEGLVSDSFPPSGRNLIRDFDDYAPFMLWFGEEGFIGGQIKRFSRYVHEGLPCFSGRVVSFRCNEYLGGLVAYYRRTSDDLAMSLIRDACRGIRKLLVRQDKICAFHSRRWNITPHIADPRCGSLIEVLIDNRDLVPQHYDEALNGLRRFIESPDFVEYGLFPSKDYLSNTALQMLSKLNPLHYPRKLSPLAFTDGWRASFSDLFYLIPMGWEAQLAKHNTSIMYALIAAFRATEDVTYSAAIIWWIRNFRMKMLEGGGKSFYYLRGRDSTFKLALNFPAVDCLCDTYKFVECEKEVLDLACNMADFWLHKRMKNGLFPMYSGSRSDFLDDQTDMVVSLNRLHELTGNNSYREAANQTLDSILKYHKTKYGFCQSVDENCNIVDPTVDPKFNALLLKPLILYLSGTRIYDDDLMQKLMQDR